MLARPRQRRLSWPVGHARMPVAVVHQHEPVARFGGADMHDGVAVVGCGFDACGLQNVGDLGE